MDYETKHIERYVTPKILANGISLDTAYHDFKIPRTHINFNVLALNKLEQNITPSIIYSVTTAAKYTGLFKMQLDTSILLLKTCTFSTVLTNTVPSFILLRVQS
jgi:hypothetical protein